MGTTEGAYWAESSLEGGIETEEAQRERDERVVYALADVGPSVLSGITFTKLIGMCVLGLTRSKLLEVSWVVIL